MTLQQQIDRARSELRSGRPQTRRRMALRAKLRVLTKVQQIRREIRENRKS